MTVSQIIAILTQLISAGVGYAPLVAGWIADKSFLQTLQDANGPDYVPTAADFAPYQVRSAVAEAQIDANASAAGLIGN